jgi:hypothetical protein
MLPPKSQWGGKKVAAVSDYLGAFGTDMAVIRLSGSVGANLRGCSFLIDRLRIASFGLLCIALLCLPGVAFAGPADVVAAEATCRPAPGRRAASICSFDVSVRHADAGWDHYANRWDVVGPDGVVIASRVLEHPHVDEQPFRRSLGRVRIPWTTTSVVVRANDSVHGGGGAEVIVVVPHAVRDATKGAAPEPVE